MSNTPKDLVRSFYEADVLKDTDKLSTFLHPEIELYWNSSFGFSKKDFNAIKTMFEEMSSSFLSFRTEITHLLSDADTVTVRYTYFAKTIEKPEKEDAIGHFITIWEIREHKLYRGYQISQQGDETSENLETFVVK